MPDEQKIDEIAGQPDKNTASDITDGSVGAGISSSEVLPKNAGLEEIAKEVKTGEKWLIGVGLLGIIVSSITAFIYFQQLVEMVGVAGQTDALTRAYRNQAMEMQKLAQETHILAAHADDQATAARESVLTAQHALLVTAHSQRAWIGLKTFHIITFSAYRPVEFEVDIINTGQTPALAVKSGMIPVWLKTIRSDSSKKEEISKARKLIVLKPNESIGPGQTSNLFYTTASAQVDSGISAGGFEEIKSGRSSLYYPGRIEFDDVFHRHQWIEFCVYITSVGLNQLEIEGCPLEESRMSYQEETKDLQK
ncbi:hypothetical protein [Terriglobus sp. TAA 43]|uniref:hypothetical protein n=1 Tax=Terriglobus sp. TAA 43 TaxID=278961 RepID=UPI0006458657|nr:hypothetical protein [Terriglobus sp. TAA 43]